MSYKNYRQKMQEPSDPPFPYNMPPRQRTIPEMFSGRPSEMHSLNNNRFSEYVVTERAAAPKSLPPNSSYYGSPNVGYEAHDSQFRMPSPVMQQQHYSAPRPQFYPPIPATPQRSSNQHFYEPATPVQASLYSPMKSPAPQNQPYYGVPGFYTPSYDYGNSSMMSGSDSVPVQDDLLFSDFSAPMRPRQPPLQTHTVTSAPPSPVVKREIATPSNKRPASAGPSSADVPAKKPDMRFTMELSGGEAAAAVAAAPKPRAREARVSTNFYSGSVSNVLKWEPLREMFPVLFEVIATLKAVRDTDAYKELLLRDETGGPVLQVLFYEIDRPMPQVLPGNPVRVVGRFIGRTRVQAFSVRPASKTEASSLQRIAFACQRAIAQLHQQPEEGIPVAQH